MEPGHEDREYGAAQREGLGHLAASMEPGHEDREYLILRLLSDFGRLASMEPGHEDREYMSYKQHNDTVYWPQWSPVMKTGNTKTLRITSASSASLNGARS